MSMIPGLVLEFAKEHWDFNDEEQARQAEKLVKEKRAVLIKVCPNTAQKAITDSLLQMGIDLNNIGDWKSRHVDWCIRLCKLQH